MTYSYDSGSRLRANPWRCAIVARFATSKQKLVVTDFNAQLRVRPPCGAARVCRLCVCVCEAGPTARNISGCAQALSQPVALE
jgi:hypothetical protein